MLLEIVLLKEWCNLKSALIFLLVFLLLFLLYAYIRFSAYILCVLEQYPPWREGLLVPGHFSQTLQKNKNRYKLEILGEFLKFYIVLN